MQIGIFDVHIELGANVVIACGLPAYQSHDWAIWHQVSGWATLFANADGGFVKSSLAIRAMETLGNQSGGSSAHGDVLTNLSRGVERASRGRYTFHRAWALMNHTADIPFERSSSRHARADAHSSRAYVSQTLYRSIYQASVPLHPRVRSTFCHTSYVVFVDSATVELHFSYDMPIFGLYIFCIEAFLWSVQASVVPLRSREEIIQGRESYVCLAACRFVSTSVVDLRSYSTAVFRHDRVTIMASSDDCSDDVRDENSQYQPVYLGFCVTRPPP
ncbi:hypothetical protein BKA63DRAFT_491151 [Paraphoma chrysanthemicola]|nr:hypothetical protein BKA63DRAFT_491151 [Paraphoma chrysanthemicola]